MLVKWNPFDELTRFEKSLNGLFDSRSWSPDVNIYEDKEKISLEVEVPGIDLKDIDIKVDSNILTIKGEKKFSNGNKNKEYYRFERTEGSFMRSFSLPNNVDSNKIDAFYDKGILTVNVPKKSESIIKKIEIKSSS